MDAERVEVATIRKRSQKKTMTSFPRFSCGALMLLFSLAGAAENSRPGAAVSPTTFRVMSYNVRNSNAQDGENAWSKRLELFFEPITRFNPDLIGFQEVLAA